MSSTHSRRFAELDVLKAIHPNLLLAVLMPHAGYLASRQILVPGFENGCEVNLDKLHDVLLRPDENTPTALSEAFYLVHQLGTVSAMNVLLDEARFAGIPLDRSRELTPEDVVAQLWLRNRAILDRVLGERLARRRRQFDYFQGTGTPKTGWQLPEPDRLRGLEQSLDDWFEAHDRGRGSKVMVYERSCGALFVVRHGQPLKRVGSLHQGRSTAFAYRPERHDVIAYDARIDELQINADSAAEKTLYRTAFGRHLFGSTDYFPGDAKYTLEPLRRAGAHTLDASDVPGIDWVKLREVVYSWPGYSDEIVSRRSDKEDLLPVLGKHGKGIHHEARLLSAAFVFKFKCADRPRLVTIRSGNVAEYTRDEDAELVERWLQARAFMNGRAA